MDQQPVTRLTIALSEEENRLLLALQAHIQGRTGRAVARAEVMREGMRRFAAIELFEKSEPAAKQ